MRPCTSLIINIRISQYAGHAPVEWLLCASIAYQVESNPLPDSKVSFESLIAQRRVLYGSLSQPASLWTRLAPPRWMSAVATTVALGGGLMFYQHRQTGTSVDDHTSDAQLASQVSEMAQGPEASPVQPLPELFE